MSPDQPAQNGAQSMLAVSMSREAQQVNVSMMAAKRWPRNDLASISKLKLACQRLGLAEAAEYSYRRGDTMITGPSIRLAEAAALAWGNMDSGWYEVERKDGESICCAFATDLESNCRKTIVFTVRHWRDTKSGGYELKDERDLYELMANQSQRRVRACIRAVMPGDLIEDAQVECERTIKRAAGAKPLADRIEEMTAHFQERFQVTAEMLEKKLQHRLGSTTENELIRMRRIFTALKDGLSTVAESFPSDAPPAEPGQVPLGQPRQRRKATPAPAAPSAEAAPAPAPAPVAPPPAPPMTTLADDVRAKIAEAGHAADEPLFVNMLTNEYCEESEDYRSLEQIEGGNPAVLASALREFPMLLALFKRRIAGPVTTKAPEE